MRNKPAIVVVGYNRPNDLERLLNYIGNASYPCNDITLIISLDKADNEDEVVGVAKRFNWEFGEKIIRQFPERQGLRKHVLQCGDLSEKYGSVIILEDDLVVAPNYYDYVVQALDMYEKEEYITGIALYSHEWDGFGHTFFQPIADQYDNYFGQFSITWGQCWTFEWWKKFKDWYAQQPDDLPNNPKIPDSINKWSKQSWGKFFVNYIVEQNYYYVIPRIALTTNFSDVGQHNAISNNTHQVRIQTCRYMNYRFAPFNEGAKYDIYFENIDLVGLIQNQLGIQDVTISLHGLKPCGTRYFLSTRSLPYNIIKEYGLQMRPYDMNIILDVPGNGIFLYDTYASGKSKSNRGNVLKYEIRGFLVQDVWRFAIYYTIKKIQSRIRRIKKRLK